MVEAQKELNVPANANEGCPGVKSEVAGRAEACEGCPNENICSAPEIPANANQGCPGVKSENAGKTQQCDGCPNQSVCDPKGDVPEDANESCPGVKSENAGKSEACDGCPNQNICASGEAKKEDPDIDEVRVRLSNVKNIVLVLSGKGGVGKSTVSTQLALSLAQDENLNVGLLDIDICGPSVPRMLGLEGHDVHKSNTGWSPVYLEDNFAVMSIGFMLPNKDDPVIWRGSRKNGLIKQFLTDVMWDELDYLIIDTPPGTSDEHISTITYLQKANVLGAVVVTTPQEVAIADVRKELNFCVKTNTNVIGVVENMSGFVCPGCKLQTQIFPPVSGGAAKMCQDFNVPLLSQVPLEPQLLMSTEKGKCYMKEFPESITATKFKEIVDGVSAFAQKK